MYIKSIVVDGFKSYAQRTEINDFDPLFNAITGLNGSGKSNILDSICFVLGISNLTQVRATNLQELVYKNGQSGVTKATVNITFDNTDKKQSPLGYNQYDELTITRQVVIGGRNKYLINGSNAHNTRVQDLFRSVQLNVNNPHFLIMQGRITKVLNMKPPEILSMLEEAAGTRLYEAKKETAQKTIAKKDMKLQEIDRIVKEDISPTLTKLKEERSSYMEYQRVIRELEHLNKVCIAWQFLSAQTTQQKSVDDLVEMETCLQKLKDKQVQLEDKVKELDVIIAELEHKRDKEAGGALTDLEKVLADQRKKDSIATSALTNKKDTLKAEQKKEKELNKHCTSDAAALKTKHKEMSRLGVELEKLESQCQGDSEAQSVAQKNYQAVSAGLSSTEDGQAASVQDQLTTAETDLSKANSDIQEAQMRLKHSEQDVKKKQAELKKTEQGYKKHQASHQVALQAINKLEAEMKKLGYEEGHEERLTADRRTLLTEVQHLQDLVDTLEARFPQLQFDYKDPEKNFDRSKVHGLVARLITVTETHTATALEVAAGGKLYNVVVDSEVTGKKLLQRGELRRRYTIIPLNKITAKTIPSNVVQCAQSLVGKNKVHTALSLVGYQHQVEAAMKFVFGGSFVCEDMECAKKVTYDERVMKRSVTLGGDSFDPAGTLTGGARPQTGAILAKLTELGEKQNQLREKTSELQQLEAELTAVKKKAARYGELRHQFEVKTQEARDLEENLQHSTHGQQLTEVNALLSNIQELEKTLASAKETKEASSKRVKELEYKMKNAKALREKELKEAENAANKAKKKMEESEKKMKTKQQEVEILKLECAELEKDIGGYETQISAVKEAIDQYQQQVEELQEAANQTKTLVSEAETAVNEQKKLLKSCSREIVKHQTEKQSAQQEMNKDQLSVQETQHKITKLNKDSAEAARQVEYLLEQYEWIRDEKKYFGQPNTAYDFQATSPKEAQRRVQKLKESKDKLAKNVNMRAMNMLDKAEEQYNDLMKKRTIVLNDKEKIAAVIAELDKKKNEALQVAHKKVNKDFGSIFSSLLPGTQAKLVAPENLSILDGLEVKIAFGDVWKESLTELSGGQRSLVALSLILSLLLFKPAPLYILDEVDAALDLSHTQNIGQMLRTHFRHSQFIVVSLKDGMFNNANVLFKTKFVDGVSTVTRYVQQPNSRSNNNSVAPPAGSHKSGKASTKRPRLEIST